MLSEFIGYIPWYTWRQHRSSAVTWWNQSAEEEELRTEKSEPGNRRCLTDLRSCSDCQTVLATREKHRKQEHWLFFNLAHYKAAPWLPFSRRRQWMVSWRYIKKLAELFLARLCCSILKFTFHFLTCSTCSGPDSLVPMTTAVL